MRSRGVAAIVLGLLAMAASSGALPAGDSPSISDEEAATLYRDGSAAYDEGRYQDAVRRFESLLDGGIRNARTHYNLSCSLYRAGEIGPAVQHAEIALALDPSDTDARENLEYIRSQLVDRYEPGATERAFDLLDRAIAIPGPDNLAIGLVVLECLSVLLVSLAIARRRGGGRSALLVPAATGAVVLTLLAGAVLGASAWRRVSVREGIILPEKVEALSGPGPTHPALFAAHAGLKVRIRGEREGWVQVRTPTALSGWIREEELGRVRVP